MQQFEAIFCAFFLINSQEELNVFFSLRRLKKWKIKISNPLSTRLCIMKISMRLTQLTNPSKRISCFLNIFVNKVFLEWKMIRISFRKWEKTMKISLSLFSNHLVKWQFFIWLIWKPKFVSKVLFWIHVPFEFSSKSIVSL